MSPVRISLSICATVLGLVFLGQVAPAGAWSPDIKFGRNGSLPVSFDVSDMVVDRKGQVVVVGVRSASKYEGLSALKFNREGSKQTSFGLVTGNFHRAAQGVAIDSRNRILVAGYQNDFRGSRVGPSLTRFEEDGTRDRSFKSPPGLSFPGYGYSDVSATDDGGILVVGARESGGPPAILIRKFRTDGTKDRRFGRKGSVFIEGRTGGTTSGATNLRVLGSGKFIVSGVYNDRPWVGQFRKDGSIDRSFGRGGMSTYPITADPGCVIFRSCAAFGLEITRRHEIRMLANRLAGKSGYSAYVVGFKRDGSQDRNFGKNGKARVPRKLLPFGGANLALRPDSSLAVLGGSRRGSAVSVSEDGRQSRVIRRMGRGFQTTTAGLGYRNSLFLATSDGGDGRITKLLP